MKIFILSLVALLFLNACGTDDIDDVARAIVDKNMTNEQVVNIDVNETTIITSTEVNQTTIVDNDVNIEISALDYGVYGAGTIVNPFQMMKANYRLKADQEYWFITPSLNHNCTIRVRALTRVNNIYIEDEFFNSINYHSVSPRPHVFEFDINSSSYANMSFITTDACVVTIIGECLDEPKLYNLDYSQTEIEELCSSGVDITQLPGSINCDELSGWNN